jgi:hypothetical protein
VQVLAARLAAFWLADEVVLYAGLAGTSVHKRVRQYYATPLGAKRPHAGGWWLKTLTMLDELWVHWSGAEDPDDAEQRMLSAFADAVSPTTRDGLHDRERVAPFANLRTSRGVKRHGITGATGELAPGGATPVRPARQAPSGPARPPAKRVAPAHRPSGDGGHAVAQRVTAKDLEAGRIRLPRSAKRFFPAERTYEVVVVRGRELRARWDPRTSPDQERSGVLAFGKGKLDGVVSVDDVLTLRRTPSGRVQLK